MIKANSQKITFTIHGGKGRSRKPTHVELMTEFTHKISSSPAQQLGIMQLIYQRAQTGNICDGLISDIDPVYLLLNADFEVGFWYIITCRCPWYLLLVYKY